MSPRGKRRNKFIHILILCPVCTFVHFKIHLTIHFTGADLGLSGAGGHPLKGADYHFVKISQKVHEIEKFLVLGGVRRGTPLDPPMYYCQ